jgi:4-hydroxybenzoate polyprenyltransferase
LYRNPVVLSGALVALLALAAWIHRARPATWLAAAIVAATMLAAEWASVRRGIWRYDGHAGLPLWLAPLWALVVFFIVDVKAALV